MCVQCAPVYQQRPTGVSTRGLRAVQTHIPDTHIHTHTHTHMRMYTLHKESNGSEPVGTNLNEALR